MVTLKDEISSQENMEQWMSQLGHPENPISNKGVLVRLQPQFVSCDFEKRENCIAFEDILPLAVHMSLHGGIIITCFDVAFGLTCHYYAKQHQITTVNLTTTFLKPVFLGDVVEYRVRITHLGRTLVSMMAEGHVNRKGKDVLIGTTYLIS